MEQQIDSILFLLPENERNTIKSFLLMQHERIEKLENLYDNLIKESWSKTWKIQNLNEEQLRKLATALYDRSYEDLIFFNMRFHEITKDLYIHFKSSRCKTFVMEWVQKADVTLSNNDIVTTDELRYVYNYNWTQLSTLKRTKS